MNKHDCNTSRTVSSLLFNITLLKCVNATRDGMKGLLDQEECVYDSHGGRA